MKWVGSCHRSSCPEVFCKIGALENFSKLTGTHLCQSLFFNKVAGLSLQGWQGSPGTGDFLWILRNFQEHLFLQNTSGGCFCCYIVCNRLSWILVLHLLVREFQEKRFFQKRGLQLMRLVYLKRFSIVSIL